MDASAPSAPTGVVASGSTVSGTAEAGATVTVKDGAGTVIGTAVADGTGKFSVTLSPSQVDGTQLTTTVTDPAGNSSNPVTTTVDAAAPSTPVLALGTGVIDGATAAEATAATGAVTVTAENGAATVVTFTNGANTVTKTVTGTGAAQAVQLTSADLATLGDGTISVSATATDAAGNASSAGTTSFTLDTVAPATPAAPTSYKDNVGSVTSDASTVLTTDDTAPGILVGNGLTDTPTLYVDGQKVDATYDPISGTLTPTAPLQLGPHTIAYTLTDAAGNESAKSPGLSLTVDSSVPTITITSVAGDTVGPTGNGTYDGAERGGDPSTVTTRPVISGTSANLEGQTVTVTVNNVSHTTTVQTGGAWSLTLTEANALSLNHGNTYNVYVSATNQAGNTASDYNNGLHVNTAQPDVPTVLNNLSSTTTPTLSGMAQKFDPSNPGTLIALQSGDTLSVTINGVAISGTIGGSLPAGLSYNATTKTWSLNTANAGNFNLQNNHTYDVAVHVVTGAGTVFKDDVSSNELVINTTSPTVAIDPISTDDYINRAEAGQSLIITGTTTTEVGSTITLTGLDGVPPLTTQVIAGTGGVNTFSLAISDTDVAAFTTTDGSKTVTVSVTNPFGLSGSNNKSFIVDTAVPSAPTLALGTGVIDGATVAEATAANGAVTVSAENGASTVVTFSNGSKTVIKTVTGTGVAQVIQLTSADLATLGDGTISVSATATDAAGNASNAGTTSFTLDTSAPAAPVLALGAGVNNGATATEAAAATGAVTVTSETGATTVVTFTNGSKTVTKTITGTSTAQAVQLTSTDLATLGDGTISVSATATDAAGNASSAGTTSFTLDTIAPSAPTITTVYSDSGVVGNVANNWTTGDLTPTVKGTAEALSTVTIVDAVSGAVYATTTANSSGLWEYTPSSNLPAGTYQFAAKAADAAGNTGPNGSTYTVTLNVPVAATSVGGSQTYDGLGRSVANIGDFNGDGIDDFIVSAPHLEASSTRVDQASNVYIVYGKTNGLPSLANIDNLTAAQGIKINDAGFSVGNKVSGLGNIVAGRGDLNGDGYADVVLANQLQWGGFVLWGRGGNTTASISVASMATTATQDGFRISPGTSTGSNWLGSGASIGDINGDGYADLIFGDADNSGGLGAVRILYGHAGTPGSSAWQNLTTTDAGYAGASGAVSTIRGSLTAGNFGDGLSVVGDVNGDGYVDFVVNAPGATINGYTQAGVSYLVLGRAEGVPTTTTINALSGVYKLNGSQNYEHLGGSALITGVGAWGDVYYNPGKSVSGIGDINGDGIGDFAIGSPAWGDSTSDGIAPGRVYVMYGKANWSDINLGSLDTGSSGFILTSSGNGANADLGLAVAGGGDFNGDRYADFLVTASNASTGGLTNNGAVYLVFGKAGGFSGTVDLDTLVSQGQALKWTGAASGVYMGTDAAMGDWNHDGLADVAIPSWEATSNSAAGAGSFKIYYGNSLGVKGSAGTTPVTLDLNGDGQIGYSHVVMDVNNDGVLEHTAWTDAMDGVLVWDKLGDGVVHDNSQYAFSQYGGNTDLEGLAAAFDTNQDGMFNSLDALFKEFAVWQDANQNGVSDAGEVKSLTDLGIAAIHLGSDQVQRQPADGVVETGHTTATMADGTALLVADAQFAYEEAPQQQDGTILLQTADTSTTTVNNHTYTLWSQSGASLFIDANATVQQPIL